MKASTLRSILLIISVVTLPAAAASSSPRDVEITAPDGIALKATYYAAASRGPAVLLLHMCNSDRRAWEPVARQLSAAGISALALDYRGFGESAGERFENDPPKQQRMRDDVWPGDIDAAFAYLTAQPGVERARIGAAGGSCGVNQAVQVARRHLEVKSLVLLAGDTNREGLNFLQHARSLPIFTAAAADDQFIADAPGLMKWIADLSGDRRNKFVGFKDGKHGTEIFGAHPELPKQIVAWYVETLMKSPAHAKRGATVKKAAVSELWSALNEVPPDRAEHIANQTRRRDPAAYLFPELVMNELGYARLQARQVKEAIQLFKLWVEAYPSSANAYD